MGDLSREEKRRRYTEKRAKKAAKPSEDTDAALTADRLGDVAQEPVDSESKPKKEKKEKKRKHAESEEDEQKAPEKENRTEPEFIPLVSNGDALTEERPAKKSKEDKKKKVKASADSETLAAEVNGDGQANGDTGKKQRFICFIGNLPFSATKEDLTNHFKSVHPGSIRLMTKPTGESRGFAFLEFEGYDRMKTCLKLYHHSTMGEGKKARKINVELTAGGGGKSESRKEKIQTKNQRLSEQRHRRVQEEQKRKQREDKKQAKQGGKPADKLAEESKADAATAPFSEHHQGIHPSRLARIQR